MFFSIPRGASQSFAISNIKDSDGNLIDLATWRIYVTVRVDDNVIISKANTLGAGGDSQIEVTGLGAFKVKFLNADTAREPCKGTIDGFIVKGTDHIQVIKMQAFNITQAVTRAFPVP